MLSERRAARDLLVVVALGLHLEDAEGHGATTPTPATTSADLGDGHAARRHLRVEHARAARLRSSRGAAQVDRRLFILADADRLRDLLAVRVRRLDDVVALGDAVDGERRGAEVTALEEDLDLRFGRRPSPPRVPAPRRWATRSGRGPGCPSWAPPATCPGSSWASRCRRPARPASRSSRRAARPRRSPGWRSADFFFFASAVRAGSSVAPPNSTARSAMPQTENEATWRRPRKNY